MLMRLAQLWRMRGFEYGPELSEFDRETIRLALPATMTSPLRLQALIKAVRYVTRHGIPGAIVECGVWRGGSMFAAARTLLESENTDRDLYLFDTFSGMTEPDSRDFRIKDGRPAEQLLRNRFLPWNRAVAQIDLVKRTMISSGIDPKRLHYIAGRVEETLPDQAPHSISILRLDTDWYSSTLHELKTLYSRLSVGGVLIIDDYGWWAGSRKAVDEFLAELDEPVMLHAIDNVGRISVRITSSAGSPGTDKLHI